MSIIDLSVLDLSFIDYFNWEPFRHLLEMVTVKDAVSHSNMGLAPNVTVTHNLGEQIIYFFPKIKKGK